MPLDKKTTATKLVDIQIMPEISPIVKETSENYQPNKAEKDDSMMEASVHESFIQEIQPSH